MSLSKIQIKKLRSLTQKKNRFKHSLFVVEGAKAVREFLTASFELEALYVSESAPAFFDAFSPELVSSLELKKISTFSSPSAVLAVFKMPQHAPLVSKGLTLALDGINDPGNLGTIIRLCDWFGIAQLFCSTDTVDCYNAKVVQATMGSLARVQVNYLDLEGFLKKAKGPVFMADAQGDDIYKTQLPKEAVLVMGNEANGIRPQIRDLCQRPVAIPRFGALQKTESLNVASATAILLSEFKRR